MNKIQELEQLMGTKHVLVDDWNRLGWEFFDIPFTSVRACSLTNYTESKAEGGTIVFTIRHEYVGGARAYCDVIHVLTEEGSGPHGVPWYDVLISQAKIVTDVKALAEALKKACDEESKSGYWAPWRDDKPQRELLFKDKASPISREVSTFVPYPWKEEDWNESSSRAL